MFLFPSINFLRPVNAVERMETRAKPLLLSLTLPSLHGLDGIEVRHRSRLSFHLQDVETCSLRYWSTLLDMTVDSLTFPSGPITTSEGIQFTP